MSAYVPGRAGIAMVLDLQDDNSRLRRNATRASRRAGRPAQPTEREADKS